MQRLLRPILISFRVDFSSGSINGKASLNFPTPQPPHFSPPLLLLPPRRIRRRGEPRFESMEINEIDSARRDEFQKLGCGRAVEEKRLDSFWIYFLRISCRITMDLGDVIGRKNAIIDRFRKFWLDFLVSLEIRTRQIFALQFRFERSSSFLFLLLNISI